MESHMSWDGKLDKGLIKGLLGRAHLLKPAVVVGQAGLTDRVVEQVRRVFQTHDLLKIRIETDERGEVRTVAEQLAVRSGSTLVNRIGKVALLYKPLEKQEAAAEPRPAHPPRRPVRRAGRR